MRALTRKLLRDLWGLRGPALAVTLVVGAGISVFVMSLSTLRALERAQQAYYERERFADVFVPLKRAPLALAERLRGVPGVAAVETRVVGAGRLEMPGLLEPATARLVSIPDDGPPALNGLYLRSGRWPEPGRAGEVLVSEAFAAAHHLAPGARLPAVLDGRRQALAVVGVALSPEFVYSIQPGQLLPDDRRFAVLWARRGALEDVFGQAGAFNDACVRLARGAQPDAVVKALDDLTAAYGGLGAYARDQQTSFRYVDEEIGQLSAMASVPPAIFLLVAAFLLHVVLGRLIGTQREQIAALKSFGYTNGEVGRHYLGLAAAMVLPGVALGLGVGAWLGVGLTRMYTRFFHFPTFTYALPWDVAVLASATALVAAVAGTLGAVRRAVRLPPAEAMRPEAPARFRPLPFERHGLARVVGPSGRMVLRNLLRRPVRALLSWLGIALAAAVLILGSFMRDSVEEVLDVEFQQAQRHDLAVSLLEPGPWAVVDELGRLPGVRRAEGFRAVPVRLVSGHRERRVPLLGLSPDGELQLPRGDGGRAVALPPDGVLISETLGALLHVAPGQDLDVEVLEGARRWLRLPVRGLVASYTGLSAWMSLPALWRWLGEEGSVSGALLLRDPQEEPALSAALAAAPRVGAVVRRRAALDSFRTTIAENMLRMRLINVLFASILAVGVVYNAARVSLAERSRDLATLRVLGFRRGEISLLLLSELWILTLLAIPAGLWLGRQLAGLAVSAFTTESYRFPVLVEPPTYAFAALVTALASLGAALVVRHRLDTLDLVAVLKAKE